jgi:hypothetical protein
VFCGLCLHHGDGYVARGGYSAGDDHVEGGVLELIDVGNPIQRSSMSATAYAADRSGER